MKFLSLDSPFMRFLSRMTDLLWLNILTIVFFILPGIVVYFFSVMAMADESFVLNPGFLLIVMLLAVVAAVPAGAAFTALHSVCLKLVRGEEGYITRDFFKSFKKNFKQATIIWMLFLLAVVILVMDFYIVLFTGAMRGTMLTIMIGALSLAMILLIFTITFAFPVLSHFENTVRGTIRNSFYMSILVLPKTILMIIFQLVPVAACMVYQIIPLAILFFFGAPAYFSAMLYNKTFKKFEPETEEPVGDYEWTVAGGEGSADADQPEQDMGSVTEVDEDKQENNGDK